MLGVLLAAALSTQGAIDVRAFGAKGDGVADDTAAIQRAADAMKGPEIGREANCLPGCARKYVDGNATAFWGYSDGTTIKEQGIRPDDQGGRLRVPLLGRG